MKIKPVGACLLGMAVGYINCGTMDGFHPTVALIGALIGLVTMIGIWLDNIAGRRG